MVQSSDLLTSRIAALNEGRMGAVTDAFARLLPASWPATTAVVALGRPTTARLPTEEACRLLLQAFDEIHATHPTAAFWWKDHDSVYLGACCRLGALAGLSSTTAILTLSEGDARLGWSRQGNLYRRDDREVLARFQPKLNIIERQDRDDGVVWLRTSKAPYRTSKGLSGTVGGFDAVDEARAKELMQK